MSNCCNDFAFSSPQGTFYMDGGIRGKDGVTFYPHVSADGVLSWTNDGGKPNPDPVNIKGADGMSAFFIAQYDVSSYDDIQAAMTAGKYVVAEQPGFVSNIYYPLTGGHMGADTWGDYDAFDFVRFDVDAQNKKTLHKLTCKKYTDGKTSWESETLPVDLSEDLLAPIEQDISDLKSALDMFKAKNVLQTSLIRGEYIKGSDPNGGKPASNNGFCRTTSLLSGYGEKISVEITDSTYEYYVSYYGENGSLDGTDYLGYSGYQQGAFVIPENAVKIGISFRRVDHASLAADELTKISNAIYYTGITDTSLSLSGKAADAKSAGQAIANATFYWSDDTNSLIRTYDDVISKYDELCALYPNYITKNALTSGDFTNYEYVLTIGNYNSQNGQRGQDPEIEKPVILISAGVHGYERSSVMGLYGFVKAMCENVTSLNKIIYAANYRIIPIACPSGYTNDSRVNSNGVNINRNFATTDWTLLPTGDNYSGAAPADQPETKVMQTWLENHNDALLYIDWHNSAYLTEISCLLGLNTTETTKWKKKYLTSLDNVIPWWMKGRNIPPSNIYAYTGSPTAEYSNTGTAVTYAREHNIETAFVLETSWNVIDKGRHARFSIGVGQEAFSNMMIGFADLINGSNVAILG